MQVRTGLLLAAALAASTQGVGRAAPTAPTSPRLRMPAPPLIVAPAASVPAVLPAARLRAPASAAGEAGGSGAPAEPAFRCCPRP